MDAKFHYERQNRDVFAIALCGGVLWEEGLVRVVIRPFIASVHGAGSHQEDISIGSLSRTLHGGFGLKMRCARLASKAVIYNDGTAHPISSR